LLAAKGDSQQTGKADRSAHFLVASPVVRGFIKQYANGVFDPAVTSILEDAFEDAWRPLLDARLIRSRVLSSLVAFGPLHLECP
jgi:hypothetical protein